ncbi:Na+/H+ antiporter NhaC [uncultured Marinococcus sp.]|uniref:Na+/H+ antiporter NhaC n=1 Tax=uncultured Marinococcus sp. TaxID=487012 RepID=UPI0026265FDB|nr:Na+/H+ antiporter NhaC [uncultured Marinococcus sp.]
MRKEIKDPSVKQVLLVMVLFILIMFSFMNWFGLPIQLALLTSWFMLMALGLWLGRSYSFMQSGLLKGISDGMEAVLILISVGALIGSWIASGIVPSIIYYGLSVMNPSIFLLAAMIICAVTSLATGTSFGTIGTAGIAMIGIGQGFDIPLPLVAGAAISGAYVGDKLSPLSDTTVMTASLTKVNIITHIKSMLYVSVPAFIISGLLFLLTGLFYVTNSADLTQATQTMNALNDQFQISWYMLIPPVIIISLLALKQPAIPTIIFGSLLGVLWGYWFQNMAFLDSINTVYEGYSTNSGVPFIDNLLNSGGIVSMLEVILLILLALGLGGLMESIGVLRTIGNTLAKWATNSGKLTTSTMLSAFFGNFFGGAAYVSVITGSKITEKNYEKLGIEKRVLSRNTEAGGTITTPMVPWSDGGVFMAATLGVATLAYLPFLWYHFLVIIISLVYGFTGKFIWYTDATSPEIEQPSEKSSISASGKKKA